MSSKDVYGTKDLRIIHAVSNTAGLPVAFAAAQREAGHRALALVYDSPFYGAANAVDFGRLIAGNRFTRQLRRARTLAWVLANFDIFHFHYYTTILPDQRDLIFLRTMGKKVVFHLHGCDIRDPRRVRIAHEVSACAECSIQCLTPQKLRLATTLAKYADAVIVSTPDLLEFVSNATYIPNPIDAEAWTALRGELQAERSHQDIIVAHAPSSREIKGTKHIERAISELQSEGLPVSLRLLEGMPQAEMRRMCSDADIIVDQVLIGWFGMFALEMMALGKPVIAYLREDLRHHQPDVPIVSSPPRQLAAAIRRLAKAPEERAALGDSGLAYVKTRHGLAEINARVMDIYRRVCAT
jgi:glycosyltransferase involved in cell wall biosynthesis